MIRITSIKIQRFRSVLNLDLKICDQSNIITICGQNNIGKTNVLRAINLFFNPDEYEQKNDIPTIKVATGGGSIHPKIQLTFYDEIEKLHYEIIRDFSKTDDKTLSGKSFCDSDRKKKSDITIDTINQILSNIEFIFIPSINTNMPELIDLITQDMLDIQYDKSRFSNNKGALKKAYDTYVEGLNEILSNFSKDISSTFQSFKNDWKIEIKVPNAANTFRELIADKAALTIHDRGHQGIEDKGSGLQRLAHILLQFEVAERLLKKKSVIICIDEPDIYLHEGLQRKLLEFIKDKSKRMQVLYTTHSRIFIDSYHLDNTILLSASIKSKYSERKKREIDVIETQQINIHEEDGFKEICNYLGLEEEKQEILSPHTIITEGGCDKRYIEELGKYFNCNPCDIISAEGADNIIKHLEFYNSMSHESRYKPHIKVLLDDDSKGREVRRMISQKKGKEGHWEYIFVDLILVRNYQNNKNIAQTSRDHNIEIEDLLYPKLVTYLANKCLKKTKKLKLIDSKNVCKKIEQKAYSKKGILYLCDVLKDDSNPEASEDYSFQSPSVKKHMAEEFSIAANADIIRLLKDGDNEYPYVKDFICELFDFQINKEI